MSPEDKRSIQTRPPSQTAIPLPVSGIAPARRSPPPVRATHSFLYDSLHQFEHLPTGGFHGSPFPPRLSQNFDRHRRPRLHRHSASARPGRQGHRLGRRSATPASRSPAWPSAPAAAAAASSATRPGQFNALVRHAYDRGIRFFETSDTYDDMHRMLGIALKGIPARLLPAHVQGDDQRRRSAAALRRAAQADQHRLLRHHADARASRATTGPSDSKRWQDGILEAQQKKIILSRGASVHGLPALRQVPGTSGCKSP